MKRLLSVCIVFLTIVLSGCRRNRVRSEPEPTPATSASQQQEDVVTAHNRNGLWAEQSGTKYSIFSPDKKRVFIARYDVPAQRGQVWDTSNHWSCDIELPPFEKLHPFFSPDGSLLCVPNFTSYTGFVDDGGIDFRKPVASDWTLDIFDARFGTLLRKINLKFNGHRDLVSLSWKPNAIVCVTRQETGRFHPANGKLLGK